jgi:hypothetical protein
MASLDDALKAVAKDPPAGFVAIAVAAAQPPAKAIVVKLKGRTLLLPDWGGTEWLWFLDLAIAIAKSQPSKDDDSAFGRAKVRAQAVATDLRTRSAGARASLDASHPSADLALEFYNDAVNLVLASNAAATGPTAGELAADAFKFGLVNAPATIATALKFAFEGGLTNMTKVQGEAAKILGELFARPLAAVTGGLLSGLGPFGVLALAAGAYYLFGRKKG